MKYWNKVYRDLDRALAICGLSPCEQIITVWAREQSYGRAIMLRRTDPLPFHIQPSWLANKLGIARQPMNRAIKRLMDSGVIYEVKEGFRINKNYRQWTGSHKLSEAQIQFINFNLDLTSNRASEDQETEPKSSKSGTEKFPSLEPKSSNLEPNGSSVEPKSSKVEPKSSMHYKERAHAQTEDKERQKTKRDDPPVSVPQFDPTAEEDFGPPFVPGPATPPEWEALKGLAERLGVASSFTLTFNAAWTQRADIRERWEGLTAWPREVWGEAMHALAKCDMEKQHLNYYLSICANRAEKIRNGKVSGAADKPKGIHPLDALEPHRATRPLKASGYLVKQAREKWRRR